MDGDSNTERHSRAFCSSPSSHVFSSVGVSRRPPFYRNPPKKQTCLYVAFSEVPLFLRSCSATLRPFSVSFSLSDFTDADPLSRGASLACSSPRAQDGNPGVRGVCARGRISVVHFHQLRVAVAPLREMCVGMATLGQRHRRGWRLRLRQGGHNERQASCPDFHNNGFVMLLTAACMEQYSANVYFSPLIGYFNLMYKVVLYFDLNICTNHQFWFFCFCASEDNFVLLSQYFLKHH